MGDDFLGDFVVGERVWVNGVKPGVIQYLGETQFAPGQWAGVVLDDPVGKNDGSVGGVRYFECQPLQGIFTRPSKLTRQPVAEGSGSDAPSVDSLTAQNLSLHSGTATPPLSTRVIPLRESVLNSAMKTGNESGSNLSDSGSVKKGEKDLRLGDRVLVSWIAGSPEEGKGQGFVLSLSIPGQAQDKTKGGRSWWWGVGQNMVLEGDAWTMQALNFCIYCYLGRCVFWTCLSLFHIDAREYIPECFLYSTNPEQ